MPEVDLKEKCVRTNIKVILLDSKRNPLSAKRSTKKKKQFETITILLAEFESSL